MGDDASRKLTARKAQQHAEGRFLAGWDEFVAHRKEVQLKFEEVFEIAQERREGETRLVRSCQQLEAKFERHAKQTKELSLRGDAFEDRLANQSKAVEDCRQVIDLLRDKTQRTLQELAAALSAMRVEMAEAVDQQARDVEQRHQSALDLMKRGDRAIADDLLKKINEFNDKLGNNMVRLEEEVVVDMKQVKNQIEAVDDKYSNVEAELREKLAEARCQTEQLAKMLDVGLAKASEDLNDAVARIEVSESVQAEQAGRQSTFEARFGKLQESFNKLETQTYTSIEQLKEQMKDQLEEVGMQGSATVLRARSEIEACLREAVHGVRDDVHKELGSIRDKEIQALRDDLAAGLNTCRDRVQRVQEDSRMGLAQFSDEHQAMYRGLVAMVEGVQHEAQEARGEVRQHAESSSRRISEALDSGLKGLSDDLANVRDELRETRRTANGAAEQVPGLLDAASGLRQRVNELQTVVTRAQAAAEEATMEVARLRAQSDTNATEMRRELTCEVTSSFERRDAAQERQVRELREELQRSLDTLRVESRDKSMAFAREREDIFKRLDQAERVLDESGCQFREQYRELKHRLSEGLQRSSEQCQSVTRQGEASVAEIRNAIGELRCDVEQTCKHWIAEAAEALEKLTADAISDATAEQRSEIQSVRMAMSEHSADSVARNEQYTKRLDEELKRELQDLTAVVDERVSAIAASTRHLIQEQKLEFRQHTARQLEERLQPLMDRVSETAGDCKASRRSEADLGQRCEKLQKAYNELSASYELTSQQVSMNAREISNLRTEMRAELRAAAGEPASPRQQQQQPRSPVSFSHDRHSPLAEEKGHDSWRTCMSNGKPETPARFSARFSITSDEPVAERKDSQSPPRGLGKDVPPGVGGGTSERRGYGSRLGGAYTGAGLSTGLGGSRASAFSSSLTGTPRRPSRGFASEARHCNSAERPGGLGGFCSDGVHANVAGLGVDSRPRSSLLQGSSPPHSPRLGARTSTSSGFRGEYW